MTPVDKYQLEEGKYYLGYARMNIFKFRVRKLLFMFVMGKYNDCTDAIWAHSIQFDKDDDNHPYNSPYYVVSKTQPIVLGRGMDFFELTDEEFLLHSVGETI